MFSPHRSVGAFVAFVPDRPNSMSVCPVASELMYSLSLELTQRAAQPYEVDSMLGGHMHVKVLFGTGCESAVFAFKGCASQASAW